MKRGIEKGKEGECETTEQKRAKMNKERRWKKKEEENDKGGREYK